MSATQTITPELRQWILEQARAGVAPEQVLQAMRGSGWDEAIAVQALEQTLQGYLHEHAAAEGLPAPVRVPQPDLAGAPSVLTVDGHRVQVLLTLKSPQLVVFGNLLSEAECDALRAAAASRLARSETVAAANDGSEVNAARTSEGMFFERGENEICARIEARIGALLGWPVDHGEGLQILRYRPGAEYLPHYDYFDTRHASTPAILKRGGQRVATLVMYLNTPDGGGGTIFPDVGLEVGPIKGNAVYFAYERPHPVTRSLHGGSPVLAGEKWVATKWLREGRFE
ncbi:2-oxoglutarate-dependent dioxygenase [Roseateles sp. DAIF2]|uniref:2OG-Fe(II) oxygenase n=1 Tax=Roseateles sp. DAIF2 TaxID=2714952 RepID=UPI0018A337BB|nr:2OG-Fe(II) oxygenase [Roseateles sp. DAIF2]QPF74485.1 2-oxoglutarate-dependent dioxygenase [Roseateles sp. DAIF2]